MDKLQRYKVYPLVNGSTGWKAHDEGIWCKSSDVERLESELQSRQWKDCKRYPVPSKKVVVLDNYGETHLVQAPCGLTKGTTTADGEPWFAVKWSDCIPEIPE